MARGDNVAYGENHYNARLTEDDVRKIKLLLEQGVPNKDIAERFKVKRPIISHIKTGRRWKHVY